jgi:hypothetical protein
LAGASAGTALASEAAFFCFLGAGAAASAGFSAATFLAGAALAGAASEAVDLADLVEATFADIFFILFWLFLSSN